MTFDEWRASVPSCLTDDAVWKVEAYRLSLFLSDLSWADGEKLSGDPQGREIAGQLLRSVGKISAQIVEGYSRTTGKDRALYFTYALGSTRESRDWYYKSRRALGEAVTAHRMDLCTSVIRLLLVTLQAERRGNRRLGNSD